MGRKPVLHNGKKARETSSRARGFATVSVTETTRTRFGTWRETNGFTGKGAADSALNAILDKAEARHDSIPWEAIREALLETFGFIERERIDGALYKAGMPEK